ncbi:hypothetical protein QVD17_05839 [Tagetes erecta]|uniref:RNA-directed DNA polymerase, eukaryota n=1 Tax=Tagetes erecta TaxID=13708 RepID=A0AAD8PBF4_TARER|nr:hypothetical protein QVD17_05839 [Tagetes erecta]
MKDRLWGGRNKAQQVQIGSKGGSGCSLKGAGEKDGVSASQGNSMVQEEIQNLIKETMVENVTFKDVVGFWGRSSMNFEFVPSVGLSGGLASMWDTSIFHVNHKIKDRNFLLLVGKVLGLDANVMVMNVYAPQDQRAKMILWDKIAHEIQGRPGVWIVAGDFNEVRVASDRFNSSFHAANARRFNAFISEADLIELNMGGGKFYPALARGVGHGIAKKILGPQAPCFKMFGSGLWPGSIQVL